MNCPRCDQRMAIFGCIFIEQGKPKVAGYCYNESCELHGKLIKFIIKEKKIKPSLRMKLNFLFLFCFNLTFAQWSPWQPFFTCQTLHVQYCYKIDWQDNKGFIVLRFKEFNMAQYPIIEKFRVSAESNNGRQVTVRNGEQITYIKYTESSRESDEYTIDFYEEHDENSFTIGIDRAYVARWGFLYPPPKYFERDLSYYSDIVFQCDYNPKYKIIIPSVGCLFISSEPPVASVYVDGKFKGRTNITSFRIHPGSHTILYEKGPLHKFEQLEIKSGYNVSHFVSLWEEN